MNMSPETAVNIRIERESDIAAATRHARQMALIAGFNKLTSYYIATAASELASNAFIHGGSGTLEVRLLPNSRGIELQASDNGPGIGDIDLAMQEGYSSVGSLGCGLPGVKRLMDELLIDSVVGKGTKVRACKWL